MKFEIYSKDNCPYCIRAVSLLTVKHQDNFEVFKLGEDFTREELLEKFPQAKTFPQIQAIKDDGEIVYIGGFVELNELLK